MSVLLLLLIGAVVAWLVWREANRQTAARRERDIQRQLDAATRSLDDAHRQTRRALNDAAGQSWRNLAG